MREEQLEEMIKELPEKPEDPSELINLLRQQIEREQEAGQWFGRKAVSSAVSSYHQKVAEDLAFLEITNGKRSGGRVQFVPLGPEFVSGAGRS